MAKEKLNPRHELFIEGVLAGKTQTQAYIDAGYAEKHANSAAARLSANVSVCQQIERREKEREESNKLMDQRVRAELQSAKAELLQELLNIARTATSPSVRLAAVRDGLDRAGMKPVDKLEHSGKVDGSFTLKIVGIDPDSFPEQDNE